MSSSVSLHFRNGKLKFEKAAKILPVFKKKKIIIVSKEKGKRMMSILSFSPQICSYFTCLSLRSQHIINYTQECRYLHKLMKH